MSQDKIDKRYSKQTIEIITRCLNEMLEKEGVHGINKPSYDATIYLKEIVRRSGGIISVENWSTNHVSNMNMIVNIDNSYEIKLSPTASILKDNFDIAHNLGHFFLHVNRLGKRSDKVSFTRYENNEEDIEANMFATSLLMPKLEFLSEWNKRDGSLISMTKFFGVSKEKIQERKSSLKI